MRKVAAMLMALIRIGVTREVLTPDMAELRSAKSRLHALEARARQDESGRIQVHHLKIDDDTTGTVVPNRI